MNKRIEELADQCNWQEVVVEDGEEWIHAHFDKQKFAELIIKECGVALSPMLRDMVSRGQAYDLIKQHFGVEE